MCPAWPLKVASCSPVYLWLQCCTDGCCACGPLPQVNLAPRTRRITQLYFYLVVYANTCSWFYFLIFKDLFEICTINTIHIINPKGLNSFFPVLKAFEFQRNLCNKLLYVTNSENPEVIWFLSRFVFWMLKLGMAKDINIKTCPLCYT